MKKILLSVLTLVLGMSANAQLTIGNSPAIGTQQTMYLLDSNATDYASVIGNNAVWDYSNVSEYSGESRTLSILDATDTTNFGTFNTSIEAFDIEDFFITYMTNDGSGKESQGFIFNAEELDLGAVVARFDNSTPEQLCTYPFDVGAVATSNFDGLITLALGPIPSDYGLTGTSTATIDGEGTLKLAGNDYHNVLRYKLVDTFGVILDSAGSPNPIPDVQIVRKQYEYYDHNTSDLPIFTLTDVVFKFTGEVDNIGQYTIVLSYEDPSTVGLSSNKLSSTKIYPNPVSSKLNIELPSTVESANVSITDAQGRSVLVSSVNGVSSVDVSTLREGIYFVNIDNENYSITKRVMIK